jgi:hypothetical protein
LFPFFHRSWQTMAPFVLMAVQVIEVLVVSPHLLYLFTIPI